MRHILTLCCAAWLACLPLIGRAAPAAPPVHTVNKAVAVVNGEMITQFDLEMASIPALMQEGLDPRDPANAGQVQEVMRRTLDTMIVDILIVQEAERLKIAATEGDVQSELKEMVERSGMPEEELFRQLTQQGMTRQQVLDRLRKRVLQQRLMANMVNRKVIVTKEEVARYFEEHGNSVNVGGEVEFAVLVYAPRVKSSDWADRLKAGKVTFEDVVKRVSVGPRPEEGGRMDRMRWDEVLPLVRMHLEDLKPGQVSAVFNLDGLDTQCKLIADHKGKQLTTLEEAAPLIEDRLRTPKLEERFKEYLAQLRAKARVEIRL
ncbi:MAG: SurA N-terminal domain-containing protein [Deltaproteobacteria bacterium]|nr:SurA N-terminal domain-containing protein [Deltaproteobacteria bacterium]